MVSKHISIWRTHLTVWIDFLDFKNWKMNWLYFCRNTTESILAILQVKFGLQAHFNMENTSNGLDWLFGLRKLKNELVVFRPKYNQKHISHTIIYIYRERERMANIQSIVPELPCNQVVFQFSKSKKSIQTVRNLYIKMFLETKIYIFQD